VKAEALQLLQEAGQLSGQESLLAQAKLLRRLAATLMGAEAAKLHGHAWLERLDSLLATDFFTAGAGRIFGAALYSRQAMPDTSDIAAQLRQLIGRLKC
jgi:hypothetical protein